MEKRDQATKIWDVVVIGGGAAGMMAAGRAAEQGRSVLLLEKNASLGKKLLITGGGRCNVLNNKPSVRALLEKYKGNNKFLFSAFSQFAVEEALHFFHSRGMPTKEEAEERVFPATNKAKSVWDVLVNYMKEGGVEIRTNSAIAGISVDDATGYFIIRLKNRSHNTEHKSLASNSAPSPVHQMDILSRGERRGTETEILAKSCIVATGGASHPETGSTGDGFAWLKKLGHTIIQNNFALVPLSLTDSWAKALGGVSLKDIKLTAYQNGKKEESIKGKMLFTHFGISGPAVLNMSKGVGDMLQYGEVTLMLDLFPSLDVVALKEKLQELLVSESNKKLKNVLNRLMPAALVNPLLEITGIDGEQFNHNVTREDRIKLVTILKAVPMHVKGLLGSDKAIISSGGVAPEEVNFKTMQSRLVPHLYLVGDILNIDRPSGGYSLQLCWTTGYIAGSNA